MNLLIEYFKSSNNQRDQEYLFCINQNINNDSIKKIFVFISDNSEFILKSDKIEIVKLDNRPTFLDLFKFCNEKLNHEICIIANTDIFFDDTIKSLLNFNFENIFLSLTRWDVFYINNQWSMKFYDNPWWDCYLQDGTKSVEESITTGQLSQDAWIFKSQVKLDERSNFLMGKPGCDNRISQIMNENEYDVRNPSKQIIIKHLHQTNYRTYTNNDLILGPYLLIRPNDDLNECSKTKVIPHFHMNK